VDKPYTIYCNFCNKKIKDDIFLTCDCEGYSEWCAKKMQEWFDDQKENEKEENKPDNSGFKSEAF
jgi:hypothetical protein